ncbi:hypothetical protein GCM10027062_36530 [Nocardioides hungaricus]
MTEEPAFPTPAEDPGEPETVPPEPERVRTGVAGVDEAIIAVEELEERPLEEHVGVFETVHDRLRRALDAGDDPA